jgi:hypothetical protein
MQHVAWLIDEAWNHRRRRYLRLMLLLLAAAVIGMLGAIAIPGGSGSTAGNTLSPPPRPVAVAPSRVLSQSPYLGVKCPIPNSIACDRVGLAVWLKQPAVTVTATIAGARVALGWFGDERLLSPGFGHREFAGYLRPAGIVSRLHIHPVKGSVVVTERGRTHVTISHQMWFGQTDARSPLIRVTIHYADGQTVITQLRVGLSAGWG